MPRSRRSNPINTPAPVVTADTTLPVENEAEELKKKVPFLLSFRTSFHQKLLAKKIDNTWEIPEQREFIDQSNNKFSYKKGNDGCEFKLKDETVKFQLLNNNPHSHTALSHCVASYVEAYGIWREKCKKQDDQRHDLIFDLTVYNEAQIRPVLAALEAAGQTLSKIKIINPETNESRELTSREEIEQYSSRQRTGTAPAIV